MDIQSGQQYVSWSDDLPRFAVELTTDYVTEPGEVLQNLRCSYLKR